MAPCNVACRSGATRRKKTALFAFVSRWDLYSSIGRYLDAPSAHRLACTCRGFREECKHDGFWREVHGGAFREPIPALVALSAMVPPLLLHVPPHSLVTPRQRGLFVAGVAEHAHRGFVAVFALYEPEVVMNRGMHVQHFLGRVGAHLVDVPSDSARPVPEGISDGSRVVEALVRPPQLRTGQLCMCGFTRIPANEPTFPSVWNLLSPHFAVTVGDRMLATELWGPKQPRRHDDEEVWHVVAQLPRRAAKLNRASAACVTVHRLYCRHISCDIITSGAELDALLLDFLRRKCRTYQCCADDKQDAMFRVEEYRKFVKAANEGRPYVPPPPPPDIDSDGEEEAATAEATAPADPPTQPFEPAQ